MLYQNIGVGNRHRGKQFYVLPYYPLLEFGAIRYILILKKSGLIDKIQKIQRCFIR